MPRMIFVNLPVSSPAASREYFGQLGFRFNAEFSDENCACLQVEDNIFVMLLQEEFFRTFITGDIADPSVTESTICLMASSREEVDETVARAIAAGGKPWKPAFADGPMYGGSFQDPDGHVWELMHTTA